jgi:hypothetical protein
MTRRSDHSNLMIIVDNVVGGVFTASSALAGEIGA